MQIKTGGLGVSARDWVCPTGPGLFWRDAFWAVLASATVSDGRNGRVSLVLVSCCKMQRFSYLRAIEEPVTRQTQPHAFVLLCLWAVFCLPFYSSLVFWLLFALCERCRRIRIRWDCRERIKNMRWWKANSIRKNAGADSQPSLKMDFILNIPQAPLSLHAAMITVLQIKTLNHLRRINVRRRYGEDCFIL